MKYNEFMNKVRHWDNLTAKWIMRHFYFMFFQIILFIIFLFWFTNMFGVIDAALLTPKLSNLERLLSIQTVYITIIVLLMLLNSFWLLYMFNGIQRISTILKDISFHISRLRFKNNK